MNDLRELSGQKEELLPCELDHNYARPWYKKFNPTQKYPNRLTKFLFLKNFPRHFLSKYPHAFMDRHDGLLEVGTKEDLIVDAIEEPVQIDDGDAPDLTIDTSSWTQQMDRLYYKTLQILQNHYISTIVYQNLPNNSVKLATLMDDTVLQLRHSFASIAGWDNELLIWLHGLFLTSKPTHDHLVHIYHEALQYLNTKIPALISKFYTPPQEPSALPKYLTQTDTDTFPPIKRIPSNPVILLVPHGPTKTVPKSRSENWKALLSSLGQLVTINVPFRAEQTAPELLLTIKAILRDKIKDIKKKKSNETRPLVLVGFDQGSLIAIHAALENPGQVIAVVCLGIPLLSINGYRGDLDDPMIDMTVPILFVIGQMSSSAPLDCMERLRESMARSDTGLVVVGGSNDKLVTRLEKRNNDNITQSIVDKCIALEIHDYIKSLQHTN